jgi:RNA polymerase sigma-70 factor (ECF subfamily)
MFWRCGGNGAIGMVERMSQTALQAAVRPSGSTAELDVEMRPLCFDELLERYQNEIFRYSMQLTRNSADADDLYQETMLKAYRAFNRLGPDSNYRAWLYRIATNTFLSQKRKDKRERPLDPLLDDHLAVTNPDQPASLDARDLLAEVEQFVQTLPEKQRVALILRKYHELDYANIAATLNSSEEAARANVYEALRKLRTCFGDRL